MYRISIVKNPSAKGVYTRGYFGPCYLEDKMSPNEIEKYKNPSNYINIASLFNDPTRLPKLKKILEDANVGSSQDWASFRHNKKYILHMCSKGGKAVPDSIHFLRPEYADYLGLSGSPVVVNTWIGLDKASRNIIEENYNPIQRDYTTRSGDVVKVAYTGSVPELLKYQAEIGTPPFSVNVWGRFLEGKKELKLYLVDRKLREAAKDKSLSPEEKQQKFNQVLEESFYGLENDETLYKYRTDPDNPDYKPEIANLSVEHKGKSKKRNISTEGFTLSEWKDLVLGGKLPAALRKKNLSTDDIDQILNGVVGSAQRVISQPKIKYTGDNPHTLEKMKLTGLSPNQYYSQNEWCDSLAKVLLLEEKINPYNIDLQKKSKSNPSDFPLYNNYKEALSNFDLANAVGDENLKTVLGRVRAWFRKRLERDGNNDAKERLKEIQSQSKDTFAIQQFIKDLESMDNLFIDGCYTKQIGSTGEKVLKKELSKSLGPDYEYQRTFSINVYPPGSKEAVLLIFDGAILKSGNIVMLFEVQGNQHYAYNNRHYKSYNAFQERLYRDKIKMDFCRQNNIPLFTVSSVLDSSEAASVYNKLATSGVLNNFVPKGSKADYNFSNLSEENIDEWIGKYVDTLIVSHFNPIINTNSYENLIPKINRIIVDLSKVVMIAITNKYNSKMDDTSFMQSFSKETLLDEGHKMLVDAFNKYFGDKYRMDYQNNVTYLGQVLKPKPLAQDPLPVQEMAFVRHKKRYKIKRIR